MNSNSTNLTQVARQRKAKRIAGNGLVKRIGGAFRVKESNLSANSVVNLVKRDHNGVVRCDCAAYQKWSHIEIGFRCEHIMAIKYALILKNTESLSSGSNNSEADYLFPSDGLFITESRRSNRGEQKLRNSSAVVFGSGRAVSIDLDAFRLTQRKGNPAMTNTKMIEDAVETVKNAEQNNVLDFSGTLRELRKTLNPDLVRHRRSANGGGESPQMVDYVEWHTVADILDETAPSWAHTIRDIRTIGDFVTVTVAITIDGITREGVGTGTSRNEMGIKKAEHDALKRAAVKFGIARELYKREFETIENNDVPNNIAFPSEPVALRISDLITSKQLTMIRAVAREKGVNADEECELAMSCRVSELSRKAASALISSLQAIPDLAHPAQRAG